MSKAILFWGESEESGDRAIGRSGEVNDAFPLGYRISVGERFGVGLTNRDPMNINLS